MDTMSYPTMDAAAAQAAQRAFVTKVFGWMTAGLTITAVVALYVATTPRLVEAIFGNRALLLGLIIGELLMVVVLAAAIHKLSPGVASALFVAYAAVNGLTLSVLFLAFTAASLASTFFITAATFGAMFVYGYTTKRDLTGLGSLCVMALIGLIVASVVKIFMANPMLYWLTTYAGVLIFVGLTAYDAQRIKMMGIGLSRQGTAIAHKAAILGALALYLDFVNLFILLLRIFGRRR